MAILQHVKEVTSILGAQYLCQTLFLFTLMLEEELNVDIV